MKAFHIDINTTKNCNLRCKYCFEVKGDHISGKNFKNPDGLIEFLDNFMDTDYYRSNFSHTTISFWGGEPTLNKDLYYRIVGRYMDDPFVMFLVYTNGYSIPDDIMESFISMNGMKINGNPKLVVQISYDGAPVHDIDRVNIKGDGTSSKIKESIRKVKDSGVYLVLKSTISPVNFKHLYDAYIDVTSMGTHFGYYPSIDLYAKYDGDEYKEFADDLYNSLVKIAAHEIRTNTHQFKWFIGDGHNNSGRALCSAGADMIAVDIDGGIVPCHGGLYMNTDDHLITNISDDDAVDKVINTMKWFKTFVFDQPDKCKNCTNVFCSRCNAVKFSVSKKTEYKDKWTDHDSQDYLCYFFDIVDLVYRAKRSV